MYNNNILPVEYLNSYPTAVKKFYPADRNERKQRVSNSEEMIEAVMGLNGEAGEVSELIKKHVYYGKELKKTELQEELGDTLHYLCRIIELSGFSLQEVMNTNLVKLTTRFSGGVSETAAISQGERK
tara:strand:- start:4 stop:384 length:381 start_codon:yes stop_codon:yes gene_type:complete